MPNTIPFCLISAHFLGKGESVLEPVDDERGGAPRRPRRRAEQEGVQQRVSGPQSGAAALSAIIPLP